VTAKMAQRRATAAPAWSELPNSLGERLSAAIRRQRPVLKALLGAAQVSVKDADEVLVDALRRLSWEEWAAIPDLDAEILVLVSHECASYAKQRGIHFVGLGPHPRKAGRRKRRR
jgi:hypothetical protein